MLAIPPLVVGVREWVGGYWQGGWLGGMMGRYWLFSWLVRLLCIERSMSMLLGTGLERLGI